jgi:hypothetical protein
MVFSWYIRCGAPRWRWLAARWVSAGGSHRAHEGGGHRVAGTAEADTTLAQLLDAHPDLVNDVATGGASPLHTCGMSRDNQHAVTFLLARGADTAAVDTYGLTPLQRMASNDLAEGARALLQAGAAPGGSGDFWSAPVKMAREAEAVRVLEVLTAHGDRRRADVPVTRIKVKPHTRLCLKPFSPSSIKSK